MMGGLSLFFLTSNQKRLLDWEDIQNKFPWGLIFLFGGGMTLAYVVNDSGLAIWLANLVKRSQPDFGIHRNRNGHCINRINQ